jgi:hypothetical protein
MRTLIADWALKLLLMSFLGLRLLMPSPASAIVAEDVGKGGSTVDQNT